MTKNIQAGRLSFTGDLSSAIDGADAIFISVGTPTRRGEGHADLDYVFAAVEEIALAARGYLVIVTEIYSACWDQSAGLGSRGKRKPGAGV